MSEAKPTPQTWTLRFKKHKITSLLFVDPTQSFDSVKQLLLDSLKQRGLKDINGDPIPDSVEEVELGVPIDKNNLKKGWVRLEIPEQEVTDAKGKKRMIGGKKSVLNASPLGADLKDGYALAYRFRKPTSEGMEDEMEMDDSGWDVLIASYDDEE